MELHLITDTARWDNWLASHPGVPGRWLQSAAWGECLAAAGRRVERVAVLKQGEPVLLAQLIYKPILRQWGYAFSPGGPVFIMAKNGSESSANTAPVLPDLTHALKLVGNYLKTQDSIGWRLEPATLIPFLHLPLRAVGDVDPPATLLVNLTAPPEALRASFHPKTRYNIRVAERHSLAVRDEKNFSVFWELFTQTAKRDRFPIHPRLVYETAFASPWLHQLTIGRGRATLAVGCFWHWNKTLVYLYGGSDHSAREYMAPTLLQWEGIKSGYALGATTYDFFGLAPSLTPPREQRPCLAKAFAYDTRHRYAGLTRFKLGFGGTVVENPGTFDLPLRPLPYALYRLLHAMRRCISFRNFAFGFSPSTEGETAEGVSRIV